MPTLPRTVSPPTPRTGTPLRRGGRGRTGRGREVLVEEDPESDAREPDQGRVSDRGEVGRDGGAEVALPNKGQLVDDGSEKPDTVLGSGGRCHCLREGMDEKVGRRTCHADADRESPERDTWTESNEPKCCGNVKQTEGREGEAVTETHTEASRGQDQKKSRRDLRAKNRNAVDRKAAEVTARQRERRG